MSTMLITYDLNSPGQDYKELGEAIKSLGGWCHNLDSTWLATTSKTTAEVRDFLAKYLDPSDELLVINVSGDGWATRGFSQEANDWLRKYM